MRVIAQSRGFRAPGFFEVTWRRWSLAFDVIYSGGDEDRWPWMLHLHLLLLNLFLHFPIRYAPPSKREPWMREWQQWGFTLCDDSVHFHWNEHTSVWNLPWFSQVHQRHEVRRPDGTWAPFIGSWKHGAGSDGREQFTFLYQYKLKRGEVQERTATVFVERRAWRPKWLTWTGRFEKQRQCIDVAFDDEVGDRSGSWKGGCVGCGYEMQPGESPEQTLRRMERERVFN